MGQEEDKVKKKFIIIVSFMKTKKLLKYLEEKEINKPSR